MSTPITSRIATHQQNQMESPLQGRYHSSVKRMQYSGIKKSPVKALSARDRDTSLPQRSPLKRDPSIQNIADAYLSTLNSQAKSRSPEKATDLLDMNSPANDSWKEVDKVTAFYMVEVTGLKSQLQGKQSEVDNLKQKLREIQQQLLVKERETKQHLEKVVKKLHEEYSRKHEVKVKELKQSHQARVKDLQDKVQQLENQVEVEREEKNELVLVCDQYLQMGHAS